MTFLDELQETIGTLREQVGPSVVGLGRGWGRGWCNARRNWPNTVACELSGGKRSAGSPCSQGTTLQRHG